MAKRQKCRICIKPGEYDLAGTIVGVVDRNNIIDGSRIQEGDAIIALPSSGLHTNGYSLARKICFEVAGLGVDDEMPGVGRTVAEALMEPHTAYAKLMQIIMKVVDVRGMAHITGGGITDNMPRILPDNLSAEVDLQSWTVPPLFSFLQRTGNVEELEMLRTFNCGVGLLFIVPEAQAAKAVETVELAGREAFVVGNIVSGEGKVNYKGSLIYG